MAPGCLFTPPSESGWSGEKKGKKQNSSATLGEKGQADMRKETLPIMIAEDDRNKV